MTTRNYFLLMLISITETLFHTSSFSNQIREPLSCGKRSVAIQGERQVILKELLKVSHGNSALMLLTKLRHVVTHNFKWVNQYISTMQRKDFCNIPNVYHSIPFWSQNMYLNPLSARNIKSLSLGRKETPNYHRVYSVGFLSGTW